MKKKRKVLIVDDELDINLLFKTLLEDNGFKVDAFDDPLLALQNFKAKSYDLLMLDIVMQKMNGFDLYEKMRKVDDKVKICFITASDVYDEQIRKEAFPELVNNARFMFAVIIIFLLITIIAN